MSTLDSSLISESLTPAHAHDLARTCDLSSLKLDNNVSNIYVKEQKIPLSISRVIGLPAGPIKFTGPILINPQPTNFPVSIETQPLRISILADVVCLPNQIAIKGKHILTNSFNSYMDWQNVAVKRNGDKTFSLNTNRNVEPERLQGTYLWLDNQHIPNQESFILNILPQLWAGEVLKSLGIDYQILVSPHITKEQGKIISEYLDVSLEKFKPVNRAFIPERTVFATSAFVADGYVSDMAAVIWQGVRERCEIKAEGADKIYISRRNNTTLPIRKLVNEKQIEGLFKSKGFTVIYPEDYSLKEMIGIVGNAEWVAGPAGKAILSIAFGSNKIAPRKLMILNSPNLIKLTDAMIASVTGDHLTMVFGGSETSGVHDDWSIGIKGLEEITNAWLEQNSLNSTNLLALNSEITGERIEFPDVDVFPLSETEASNSTSFVSPKNNGLIENLKRGMGEDTYTESSSKAEDNNFLSTQQTQATSKVSRDKTLMGWFRSLLD